MNKARSNRKRSEALSHKTTQYDKALFGILDGTHTPAYSKERWEKVKPFITKSKSKHK
jgi:hypothetical protein